MSHKYNDMFKFETIFDKNKEKKGKNTFQCELKVKSLEENFGNETAILSIAVSLGEKS